MTEMQSLDEAQKKILCRPGQIAFDPVAGEETDLYVCYLEEGGMTSWRKVDVGSSVMQRAERVFVPSPGSCGTEYVLAFAGMLCAFFVGYWLGKAQGKELRK